MNSTGAGAESDARKQAMTNPNTHGGAIHHDHGAAIFVAARLAGLIVGGCLYCGWIAAVTHVSDWMSRCPDA